MKKALYIIAILLIAIQFIPANLPAVSADNPNDLLANNTNIPETVSMILKNSCYDCHSMKLITPGTRM